MNVDYWKLDAHIQTLTELSSAAGEAQALNDMKQYHRICIKMDTANRELDDYLAECGVTK